MMLAVLKVKGTCDMLRTHACPESSDRPAFINALAVFSVSAKDILDICPTRASSVSGERACRQTGSLLVIGGGTVMK